ncbi:MAG: 6-phosphogluconolactonase [Planctomycetaceae bacterium]|nr:6-phosphogluconolactonase [Planctomycetaceae bacterium]
MAPTMLAFVTSCLVGEEGAIHVYRLDIPTGRLEEINRTTEAAYPFFLALAPQRKVLYAVHRAGPYGQAADGQVSAFSIRPATGQLTLLNRQSSGGNMPTYLAVDPTEQCLLVANFTGGSVASLAIAQDGRLCKATSLFQFESAPTGEQCHELPYTHSFVTDPGGGHALCANLGHDKVVSFKLDAEAATLQLNESGSVHTDRGSGPRHLAFHPSSRFVFVINETGGSVTVFSCDAIPGRLQEIQTIPTLPESYQGEYQPADVKVAPSGKFLYGTNRGHDSITSFSIDQRTGKLSRLDVVSSRGANPQHLAIVPDGSLLVCANRLGNCVVTFHMDADNGRLRATGMGAELREPTCLLLYGGE